jgi:hypothetical protein
VNLVKDKHHQHSCYFRQLQIYNHILVVDVVVGDIVEVVVTGGIGGGGIGCDLQQG